MFRTIISLLLIFSINKIVHSQCPTFKDTKPETVELWSGAYQQNSETTKYSLIQRIMRMNEDIQYISLPYLTEFTPLEEIPENISLRKNEGSEGILFEGRLAPRIIVARGRDDQSSFLKSSRITIDPDFVFRLTKGGSIPLLPMNTKLGGTIEKGFILKKDLRDENSKLELNETGKLFGANHSRFGVGLLSAQFMHYSNGQDSGALLYDSISYTMDSADYNRNDYASGNFSTYYVKVMATYSAINADYSLFTAGVGFRHDLKKLDHEEEQFGKYGLNRIIGTIQFRSRPSQRWFLFKTNRHHISGDDTLIKVPALAEHCFRFDVEAITDNLERFNEQKIAVKFRYSINPLYQRSLGYFIRFFYGRDYLNIRYDLPVWSLMAGVTFEISRQPFPKKVIEKRLGNTYDKLKK